MAAFVGSATGARVWSGWRVPFVTVRSSEFHDQNVVPSETSVRSPVGLGIWTRPLPSPPDHTCAVLVPFAACGMFGSAGRPSALSICDGAVEGARRGLQHRRHQVFR